MTTVALLIAAILVAFAGGVYTSRHFRQTGKVVSPVGIAALVVTAFLIIAQAWW